MPSTDGPLDRSTPGALRAAWFSAVAAGDAERLRPLLTPDYEVWAHAAPALQGVEATVEAMRGTLESNHIEQTFDVLETVIVDGWAFERGIEHVRVTPAGGGPPKTMSQRALLILRRDANGEWQYARGVTNGLPPAPPPTASDRDV